MQRRPRERTRRPQLRTQVLVGVLLVTIVALVAFDVAAVSALRRYLLGRTDSSLHAVLNLYQPAAVRPVRQQWIGVPRAVHFQMASKATIVGPRFTITPSILDQYYLVYLAKNRPPRAFITGNPFLVPRRLARFAAPSYWHVTRTVASVRGPASCA